MTKRYKYLLIIIGICATLLIAFVIYFAHSMAMPIKKELLYGTYVADYKYATEKITLKKDGTLIQEVTLKQTSKVNAIKGTWSYDHVSKDVRFKNTMMVMDIYGDFNQNYTTPPSGYAFYTVQWFFGRIYIGDPLGDANGFAYKKVGSE